MKNLIFLIIFTCYCTFSPCQSLNKTTKVLVKEVKYVNAYTYLLVDENGVEKWLAVPKMEAVAGETYYYLDAMEMTNFTSKELNKTFDKIYFLASISKNPSGINENNTVANPHENMSSNPHSNGMSKKQTSKKIVTNKSKAVSGGVTLEQLFANPKNYDGKTIIISAQITKFSSKIMNLNWIHLQDGTEFNDKFDLTATTTLEFKTGDNVVIEGKVALNKNFGSGYAYDVILEEVKLKQ